MKLILSLTLTAFTSFSVQAIEALPKKAKIQLVQSVPEETQLAVPGIKYTQETWISMIDEAKKTIDIEQMYVDGKPGESLDPVIDALKRASERSVKIRLMISLNMVDTNPKTLARLKSISNLKVSVVDFGSITGGIQHAKFWIIDGKTSFVGSQNFDWKALTQIHETGVLFEDETISQQLLTIFNLDWQLAQTGNSPSSLPTAPQTKKDASIYMVANPPRLIPNNIESGLSALTRLLKSAKKLVRISLLDFSTFPYGDGEEWKVVDQLLKDCSRRGVKIELLVSHWNTDQPKVQSIKSLSLEKNITVKIATIPDLATGHVPYSRVNHSKIMTIDDHTLWVGTSNWSRGYFLSTRGIEIIMNDTQLTRTGNSIFDRLWNAPYSELIDINRDYPKPIK